MDLGKKIQQVLKHYPSVYVDGLGVFKKVHQASSFDEQHNVFLPPIDYVEFDDRDNQGLDLIEYLRQENEISRTDAQELVAREVAAIVSNISEHGKAHIPQLGDLLTYGDGFVFRAVDLSSFVFEPISNIEQEQRPEESDDENIADEEVAEFPEESAKSYEEEYQASEADRTIESEESAHEEEYLPDVISPEETESQEVEENTLPLADDEQAIPELKEGVEGYHTEEESITADEVAETPEESVESTEEAAQDGEAANTVDEEKADGDVEIIQGIISPEDIDSEEVLKEDRLPLSDEEYATPQREENTEAYHTEEEDIAASEDAESFEEDNQEREVSDEITESDVATEDILSEDQPIADRSELADFRKEVPFPEPPPLIQNKSQTKTPAEFIPADVDIDDTYASAYVEEDDRSNMIWYIVAAVVALSIIGALWYVTRPASLYSGENGVDVDDEIESPYAIDEEFRVPAASTEVVDTSEVLRERPDTAALVGQNPVTQTAVPAHQPLIPENHNWYIVIGSRLPLADAKEMANEFNKKGQARVRIIPGRGDGSPATVIWDSYVTKEQADSALRHVRKNFVADAWHKAVKK